MTGRDRPRSGMSLALAAVLAASLVALPAPVVAHDHRIPRTKLISKKAWQRGRLQSFCWATGHSGNNVACAGGAYSWPGRDRTPGARSARLRINKTQAPRRLTILRWRQIDEKGAPVGEGKVVRYRLETTVHNGKVVQEARFRLPARAGHVYLTAYGMWRDVVSGRRQNATWNFHLKLH